MRSSKAVTSLIYEKSLRLSQATNKQFEQGEIVNFVQIDAPKIYDLAFSFPDVAKLPLLLIYALFMAFYYFKWTLYGGILLLLASSVLNYYLAKFAAGRQKIVMQQIDERMNSLTEIINNIKIIKLNSYIDSFLQRLMGKR